jgi:hypothetical protein
MCYQEMRSEPWLQVTIRRQQILRSLTARI